MPRVIFSDNDIILKLADYNILSETCSVLGVGSTEIAVLDSAKHVFANLRKKLDRGDPGSHTVAGLDRAIEFAKAATQITEQVSIDWAEEYDNINIGEAQLATWVVETVGESMLLTGDKRFLIALAGAPECRHIADGLRGRVICLEELIRALINEIGFDQVRTAIASVPDCDKGLHQVFGSRFDLPQDQVMDGLVSMLREIAVAHGDGWLGRVW
ncbi:MAG: hypothetical protein M1305_02980 [Candidatus Marsarchaeota archaeon]|nr:hypothetical protein [Candidatus Marsarchaeota archaeon]